MPGLSYPFVYECSNCEAETTITRTNSRDVYPNPDSINAHTLVLRARGWMRDASSGHDEDQSTREDTGQLDAFSGR